MASKKKVVKNDTVSAIEKTAKVASIEAIESASFRLWEAFASNIANLTVEQYPQAVQFVKTIGKLAEETEKGLKKMVVALLEEKGKQATDAGTRRLTVSGYVLEIQPTSTGLDSKKVEALLRAKGIPVERGMDAQVTYSINEGKLADLVKDEDSDLTQDELDTCKKEAGWKMMSPKKES